MRNFPSNERGIKAEINLVILRLENQIVHLSESYKWPCISLVINLVYVPPVPDNDLA